MLKKKILFIAGLMLLLPANSDTMQRRGLGPQELAKQKAQAAIAAKALAQQQAQAAKQQVQQQAAAAQALAQAKAQAQQQAQQLVQAEKQAAQKQKAAEQALAQQKAAAAQQAKALAQEQALTQQQAQQIAQQKKQLANIQRDFANWKAADQAITPIIQTRLQENQRLIGALTKMLFTKQGTIAEMEQTLQETLDSILASNAQITEYREIIATLNQEKNELQATINLLETKGGSDQYIKQLKAQLGQVSSTLIKTTKSLQEYEATNKNNQQELQKLRAEVQRQKDIKTQEIEIIEEEQPAMTQQEIQYLDAILWTATEDERNAALTAFRALSEEGQAQALSERDVPEASAEEEEIPLELRKKTAPSTSGTEYEEFGEQQAEPEEEEKVITRIEGPIPVELIEPAAREEAAPPLPSRKTGQEFKQELDVMLKALNEFINKQIFLKANQATDAIEEASQLFETKLKGSTVVTFLENSIKDMKNKDSLTAQEFIDNLAATLSKKWNEGRLSAIFGKTSDKLKTAILNNWNAIFDPAPPLPPREEAAQPSQQEIPTGAESKEEVVVEKIPAPADVEALSAAQNKAKEIRDTILDWLEDNSTLNDEEKEKVEQAFSPHETLEAQNYFLQSLPYPVLFRLSTGSNEYNATLKAFSEIFITKLATIQKAVDDILRKEFADRTDKEEKLADVKQRIFEVWAGTTKAEERANAALKILRGLKDSSRFNELGRPSWIADAAEKAYQKVIRENPKLGQ